jgi:hypothetical protein
VTISFSNRPALHGVMMENPWLGFEPSTSRINMLYCLVKGRVLLLDGFKFQTENIKIDVIFSVEGDENL